MKLGFIGLGIMGRPMVKNCLKGGHDVIVYDHNPDSINEMVEAGAIAAKNSKEVAKASEIIITMLPNSPHVKAALLDENGILNGAKEGQILIDMSSIAPLASKECAELCKAKGVKMLDAPVSGGEPKAIDGTLSIMVGGDKETFEKAKSILELMGSSVIYCGEIGSGNTTKLANQMIVAVNIAVVAEAFTMAKKAGVDPNVVYQAIRGGLAGSTVMDAKGPMMLEDNTKPGFRVDLHIKDLNNAIETGHGVGVPLPLTTSVMEMFQVVSADGCANEDHSALAKYYRKLSGVALND